MPLTDGYGQGITYPTLTDKPNAQTLGQGIVDGLTPRVVMQFSSAVVRGGTLSKPTPGMVTWLRDVGRLEVFDGTSWIAFGYGQNPWRTVFLSAGWTQNGNSQGSFQYRVVQEYGEKVIKFRGGIGRPLGYPSSLPAFFQLNQTPLPSDAWPTSLRTISVPCSDVSSERITLKLDITTDGLLKLYGIVTRSTPPWIGFNGTYADL